MRLSGGLQVQSVSVYAKKTQSVVLHFMQTAVYFVLA